MYAALSMMPETGDRSAATQEMLGSRDSASCCESMLIEATPADSAFCCRMRNASNCLHAALNKPGLIASSCAQNNDDAVLQCG